MDSATLLHYLKFPLRGGSLALILIFSALL